MLSYEIGYRFRRKHSNPPIWTQAHYHSFDATVVFESSRGSQDMYGLDMVEYESRLQEWIDKIPSELNEMSDYSLGTTEDVCLYISKMPVESHVRIKAVSVSEVPTRKTTLHLSS